MYTVTAMIPIISHFIQVVRLGKNCRTDWQVCPKGDRIGVEGATQYRPLH